MKQMKERNYQAFSLEGYSTSEVAQIMSDLDNAGYEVEYNAALKEITVYYDEALELNKISYMVREGVIASKDGWTKFDVSSLSYRDISMVMSKLRKMDIEASHNSQGKDITVYDLEGDNLDKVTAMFESKIKTIEGMEIMDEAKKVDHKAGTITMSNDEWKKVPADYKNAKDKKMLVLSDKGVTTIYKVIIEADTKTAKCPDCGGKYLVATGYCVSCKKKVGKKKEDTEEIIEVTEETRIPGTDIVLEIGDQIQVIYE